MASPRRSGASTPSIINADQSNMAWYQAMSSVCATAAPGTRPTICPVTVVFPPPLHEQGSRARARGAEDLVQEVVDAADRPGAEPGLTVGEVHRRRMPDRRDRAGHERGRDPTDAPLAAGVIAATVAERLSRRP